MHISHHDISLGRLIHLCRRRRRRNENDDADDRRRNERWTSIPKSGRRDGATVQQASNDRARTLAVTNW